jgi:DNA-binding MarR family transcriptional regulator
VSSDAAAERLGLLLKHAQSGFARRHAARLEPLGVTGRQTAVLIGLDGDPVSQAELARRLGVDRTTMVALIDELEQKGWVERRTDPADRRRNVVELTGSGRALLDHARWASDEAEREFLAPLSADDARAFRRMLRALAPIPFAGE